MTRPALLLSLAAAALAATACNKPADPAKPAGSKAPSEVRSQPATDGLQKALIGGWRLDQAALANDPELAKLPEAAKAQALETLRQLMQGTRMQFGADGALQMSFGKRTQTGRYKIVGAKAGVLTVESTTGEGDRQKTETITLTVDGDRLRIVGPDGKGLDLVREGSAADTRAPEPAKAPTSAAGAASAAAPAKAPTTATPAPGATTAPSGAVAPGTTAAD